MDSFKGRPQGTESERQVPSSSFNNKSLLLGMCCVLHVLHLSGQKENNQTETRTVLCMRPDFAETKQRIKPDHLRK